MKTMKLQATATLVNLVVFVISLVIISSATRDVNGPSLRWLFGNQSTVRISRNYYLEIVPARWALYIWYLIYTWQAAWILYSINLLCGSRVPEVLSPLFFMLFTLSMVCNVIWSVLLTWEKVQICALTLLSSVLVQYAALAESYWRLHRLHNERFPVFDFWAVQILVNNGIALYATWSTISLYLNLASAITYFQDVEQAISSTIALSILGIQLIVWFILENTILERFVRYTLTIYPAVIWALSAILARNFESSKRNAIFTIALLIASCALFIARLMYMVWRITTHKNAPNDDVTLTAIDVLYVT